MKSVNHSGSFDLLIRERKRTGKSPAVSLVYSFHFIMTFLAVTDIISEKKRGKKWEKKKQAVFCSKPREAAPREPGRSGSVNEMKSPR